MSNPRPRILYAEDHDDTREFVAFMLTQNNCEIVTTDSSTHALLLASTDNFDLYILDNWLPDRSGIDLCLKLREFDPKTPILFYSGAALKADKERALSSGAQAYITKPADSDELIATVLRLAGDSRAVRTHAGGPDNSPASRD